ncbi:Superfamily II DNA or RNA helicase, SNF2 family [Chitinophaga costaii]|uniref:Superfamily II DNA or RNA helicase, SNF2 family n=1 Tax=Chitinophaga costaii TaxID=1335309 RepID=A0A1C4FB61_9BACT|nr:DEAD/DEAH box helicase [Chitinophaga costaii]PUZ20734.1 ATP-dependent helicase [Chitinophaga costaii]SCC52905.1 Superfamily II DNA or RNA helicase, SNF2 family [Chitinophaga costaii]
MNDLFDESTAFIFAPFDPALLDMAFIAQHVQAGISPEEWAHSDLVAESIKMGAAVFKTMSDIVTYPEIRLQESGGKLALYCPCPAALPNALCAHQAHALYTLAYRDELRLFFDPVVRQRLLRPYAAPYGMQDEPLLDQHFDVQYEKQKLQVTPHNAGLFAVTPEITHDLKALLLPDPGTLLPPTLQASPGKQTFVVLRQHKYYKQICTELYSAATTGTGKLKNPLQLQAALPLAWETQQAEELKFYTGIAKFQNNISVQSSAADLEGLKAVVRNPLGLRFYAHNARISENVVANALEPVTFGTFLKELRIEVKWQEPFYHISAQVLIDGLVYPLRNTKLRFDYFIQLENTLHLVGHYPFLKVIDFFKKHQYQLTIHASKFVLFQQEVLSKLEDFVTVLYPETAAITAAPPPPMPMPERILFLSDLDNYIMITPVMKYGPVEVPIRTKRTLYMPDENGQATIVYRNAAAETDFTALLLLQHNDFAEQLENDLSYFYVTRLEFLENDWFLQAFENWKDAGITVLGFNQLKNIKLNPNKAAIAITVTSGINWFNTDINVSFARKKASLPQLLKAVRNKSRFVQLDDGTQGILPEEWIARFARYFDAGTVIDEHLLTPKVNFSAISDLYDAANLDENVQSELDKYRQYLSDPARITEVPIPAALQGTLREYQRQGLNWLNFLDDLNFGGCLADDMGLGKSLQIIAFILSQREKVSQQTNLLVVPTSLVFNWEAELHKFAPSIKVLTLYGTARVRKEQDFSPYEVVITTYGTLLSDITYLRKYVFNYIFLDESQLIKNPTSQRYKAVRLLQARNRIVITGTPVENNTFDLYGQLSFACPGLLGSKQFFKDVYAFPIDKFKDSEHAAILQRKIQPFILRRTKEQVAAELPQKTEMVLHCPMGDEQWKVYQQYEQLFRDYLEGVKTEDLAQNTLHVLSNLTKLRLICNSPILLKEEKLFGDGAAKIEMLMKQIEHKSANHKILVFSQFVGMLELIRAALEKRGIPFEKLTGSTRHRERAVQEFQENTAVRVFLVSLKAGGLGLNLTAADYVYIVDPWWNPAVENQAIDRVYRIGQQKNVVAVRLICPGTIEEKLLRLQESKRSLANTLIKSDSDIFNTLSKADLLSLVS